MKATCPARLTLQSKSRASAASNSYLGTLPRVGSLRRITLGRPIETHRAAPTKARAESHPLPSIGDKLRDRFAKLNLGTHPLKTRSQSFDLLLLLRDLGLKV